MPEPFARPGEHAPGAVGLMLRLPAFVVTSGLLALAAHGAAAGELPDTRSLLAAVLLTAAVGAVLCRRRRSFETIAAALVAGQAIVHVVLCLPHLTTSAAAGHGAHHVATGPGLAAQLVPGAPMLVAHLLAAGVTAWWLARGEAAVWSLAQRLVPALALLTIRPHLPVAATAPSRAAEPFAPLHDQVAGRRTRPRRGPPATAPAFA